MMTEQETETDERRLDRRPTSEYVLHYVLRGLQLIRIRCGKFGACVIRSSCPSTRARRPLFERPLLTFADSISPRFSWDVELVPPSHNPPLHTHHPYYRKMAASSLILHGAGSAPAVTGSKSPRRPYPSSGGSMDKRILVVYTGGTMGMLPKADGSLDVSPGFFTTLMLQMEEMRHPELPHIDIYEYDELMDSACLGPRDWGKFAGDIERHYFLYDGFVLVHGTDTMAYTASALVRLKIKIKSNRRTNVLLVVFVSTPSTYPRASSS